MTKKKPTVTNAMRILSSLKIPFDTVEYDAEEVGENFGMYIAGLTGIPCEMSFKTLVAKGSEYMVMCIPVDREVDLKKLAKVSGNKKVELLGVKELLPVTGYIRGGVSPIGMKKKYKTFIQESCTEHSKIAVSGGVCGVTLLLSPDDLKYATDGMLCDIIKE